MGTDGVRKADEVMSELNVCQEELGMNIFRDRKKYAKSIFQVAFPLMVQGIVFQLQNLTDKAFLGNMDTKYVSASGAAQMPFYALVDSIVALGMGLIIIVSRLYGAKEQKKITAFTKSAITFNSILGVLLFVMWQWQGETILRFFQVDESILRYSVSYVKISTFYLLFFGIDCALQGMLQGIGDTKPIMYAGMIKVGVNVIMSWALIFGKFGLPAMNVTGAALGTIIADLISTLFIVTYCFVIKRNKFEIFHVDREWLAFRPYKEILRLGIPSGLEYFLWNASNLVLIRFINGFSYEDMAIYTLVFGCQCIVYVAFAGTSRATLTLMGQNIGAKKEREVHKYFSTCILINFVIVAVAAVTFCAIPEVLLDIFSDDQKIIDRGVMYLMIMGAVMFPQSMNTICGSGIKAIGDTKWMLFSQIIGSTLVVSLSWLLVGSLGMGMLAIFFILFLDEGIRGIINYIHYRKRMIQN